MARSSTTPIVPAVGSPNGGDVILTKFNELVGRANDIDANGTVSVPAFGILVDDEGAPLATSATELDFTGAGVSVSGTGAKKTILVPAQASSNLPWVNPKDFGAVGDGVTDDTTAFTNALAALGSPPKPLMLPPGKYLIPNGITESIRGLRVIGMGNNRSIGPGNDSSAYGAVIQTTGAGKWCWTHVTDSAGTNRYEGPVFENVVFRGNAVTAGGLLIEMFSNSLLLRCYAEAHTTGVGFRTGPPAGALSGNDQSWSEAIGCGAMNCLIGFDDCYGDFANQAFVAADWVYYACYTNNSSAGGIQKAAGTVGFRVNSNSVLDKCKAEQAETGFLVTAPTTALLDGCRVEQCTTGFKLARGVSGTATGGTTSTLIDAGAAWETNRWAGYRVTFKAGAGAGQTPIVLSNTATTITFTAPVAVASDATTTYRVSPTFSSRIKLVTPRAASTVTTVIFVTENQQNDALIGYDNLAGTTLLIDNGVSTRLLL
jgi:hypothetical protein